MTGQQYDGPLQGASGPPSAGEGRRAGAPAGDSDPQNVLVSSPAEPPSCSDVSQTQGFTPEEAIAIVAAEQHVGMWSVDMDAGQVQSLTVDYTPELFDQDGYRVEQFTRAVWGSW